MGYYEATDDGGWWSCPHCYGTINALEGVPFAPAEPAVTAHDGLIAETRRWIKLHENNEYQREAAKWMKALVAALEERGKP